MIKKTFSFLFLFMLFIVLSCSFLPQEVKIEKVEFNPSSVEVEAGGSAIIQVTVTPQAVLEKTVIEYSVNDSGIAKINGTNNVIMIDGLKEGTAICSAKIGKQKYSFPVVVTKTVTDIPIIDNTTMYLTAVDTFFTFTVGEQKEIAVSLINGTTLEAQDIKWSSSDTSIADITGNGAKVLVTAGYIGKAEITVSHPQSKNTLVIYINVGAVEENNHISLDSSSLIMKIGDDFLLTAKLQNAEDYSSIIWSIEGGQNVFLLGSGEKVTVKAVSNGLTQVKAVYKNVFAVCDILIEENPIPTQSPYEYLSLDKTSHICKVGDVITIRAYISGTDFNNIVWTNLDNNILTLLGTGDSVSVKVVSAGQTKIKVQYKNITVYCDFLIEAIPTATRTATSTATVTTTKTATTTATKTVTATATKTATATPAPVFTISTDSINTTPSTATITTFTYTVSPDIVPVFTVSDSTIATITVDNTNKKVTVTALKEGLTQITCSAHNITKTIQVNCYYPELIFYLEESVIGGTNTSWYDKSYLMPDFSRLDLAECVNTQLNLSFKQGTVVTEIKWIKSTDFYPKVTTQILNDNKTINFNVSSEYNMFDEVRSGGSISCEITHNGVKTFFTITIKIYMGAYS